MSHQARPPGRVIDALRRWTGPSAESGRSTLWPWPVLAAAAAIGSALALIELGRRYEKGWAGLAAPADRDGAVSMLRLVAASIMTATSVTFSSVVLALQVASQQFSPRLLRQFTRDPIFKSVLAALVATFAFAVTVLHQLARVAEVPQGAVSATYALSLLSLGALVGFITHVAKALRVDTMMTRVREDTLRAIIAFYPPAAELPEAGGGNDARRHREMVRSVRSGFIQYIDVEVLLRHAIEEDLFIELWVRPGDHAVRGTPLAVVRQAGTADEGSGERPEAAEGGRRPLELC